MNIKSLRTLLCSVLIIVLIALSAASCQDNDNGENVKINFYVDGELYASFDLTDEDSFNYPATPTKHGYLFDNWYIDEDTYLIPFSPMNSHLYSNNGQLNVYAKWNADNSTCTHKWDEGTVLVEATDTTPGTIRYKCELCDAFYTDIIPQLSHTHTLIHINETSPTCELSGVKAHWYCESCARRYEDRECTIILETKDLTISPAHNLEHFSAKNESCFESGNLEHWRCTYCSNYFLSAEASVEVPYESILLISTHSIEYYLDIAPSCYENGKFAHWYCTDCNKYYDSNKNEISYEDIEIPAVSHQLSHNEAISAGCYTNGIAEHWFCMVCSKYFTDKDAVNEVSTSDLIMSPSHSTVLVPYTFPTCTTDGYFQHWYCEGCGGRFVDQNSEQPIDISNLLLPASHSLTHYEKRPSECHTNGDIEYWYCSACSTYFKDAAAKIQISADDIIAGDAVKLIYSEYKAPTCDEDGSIAYWYCPKCGDMFLDIAGTLELTEADVTISGAHDLTAHQGIDAGCYNDGNVAYWCCLKCEKHFLDAEGTIETTAKDVIIPASHKTTYVPYSSSDCYNNGTLEHWRCTVCEVAFNNQDASLPFVGETVIPASHTLTHTESKHATCTEYGNYEYWYCKKCNCYFTSAYEILPVDPSTLSYILPHKYEPVPYVEATCTSVGNIDHLRCSECKKLFDYYCAELDPNNVILTASHEMSIYSPGTSPTCTTPGTCEYWYCHKCNTKYADSDGTTVIENTSVEALGHDYVNDICINCNERKPSEGLEFELSYDKRSYTLVGRGTCTDNYLVIPSHYNGLPVTKIGPMAFYNHTDIYSITLPETLTDISTGLINDAFFNNYNIVEICNKSSLSIIPGSLTNGTIACYAKNVYTPNSGKSKIHETNEGLVFYVDIDDIYLIGYVGKNQRIVLPDSYNGSSYKIKDYAFIDSNITSIVIPEGVSYVGFRAFSSYNLVSITVMSDNTKFDSISFDGCYKLVEIYDLTSNPATKGSEERGGIARYALDVYTDLTSENYVIFDDSGYIWYNHQNYCYLLGSEGLTDGDGILVLPETYNGRSYEIYSYAFAGRGDFTKISFPDTLTVIGNCAFMHCDALEDVAIPLGITKISGNIFTGCASLKAVQLHSGITDIESGFEDCVSLEGISIPKSVTAIGGFTRCSALKTIEFEEGTNVQIFYDLAFYGTAITEFTFPSTVTDIGRSVFWDCNNLVTVDFEEGSLLEYISKDCFGNCIALKEIKLPDSLYRIDSGAFIDAYALESVIFGKISKPLEISEYAFSGCSNLSGSIYMGAEYLGSQDNPYLILWRAENKRITSCTVHPSAQIIFAEAFSNCTMLERITMSDALTEIQDSAFYYCTSLKSITIPENIVSLGSSVLSYCTSLTEIHFNATQLTSGPSLRRAGGSEGLTLYIGKNVKEIYSGMFYELTYEDTYLTKIVIEEGSVLEKIGACAFRNSSKLQSINLPGSLVEIGEEAFYGCNSLTDIIIGKNVTTIGYNAFAYCESIEFVRLESDKLVNLGNPGYYPYLFSGSGTKTGMSITIAKNVTSIPDYLFKTDSYSGVTHISAIIFEDGILCTHIGEGAFAGCEGNIELTIPSAVTYIGAGAFSSLNVTTLYFRAENLTSPAYDNGNQYDWVSSEGMHLVIGNTVKSIPDYCFSFLVINTLAFEDGSTCTYIGMNAFSYVSGLESVLLPESVSHIMDYAFYNCYSLNEINFPKSVVYLNNPISNSPVKKIYYDAAEAELVTNYYGLFSGSDAGFEMVIGKNVISIPDGFLKNSVVTSVIFEADSICTYIGNEAFSCCENLTNITLPESIKYIGDSAFVNCYTLKDIAIPDATERIGSYAFYSSGITEVMINKSSALTEIGRYAFAYTYITSITIPKGITSIGEYAFNGVYIDYIYYGAINYNHPYWLLEHNPSGVSVVIGNQVECVDVNFGNVTSLVFEECSSCQTIGISAFYNVKVNTVTIPDSVTKISDGAFHDSSITQLIISKNSNLTYIGDYAFKNCHLTAVTIPEKVTYIGKNAFSGCNIEELYYNAVSVQDFLETPITAYEWIGVADSGINLVIGNCVEIIPQHFMTDQHIKSLEFESESTCHTISNYAFSSSHGTKSIVLPESLETIGHNAFNNFYTLEEVVFPAEIKSIGNGAFYNCRNVKSVTLPADTAIYGESSFHYETVINRLA